MEDKLHNFFSENEFDFQEPHSGHLERFERKINPLFKKNKTSWKWLSVAASVILVLGFWLGNNHQNKKLDLANTKPKMEEVQTYFVSTINKELENVEKNRSLETETVIEEALNELEELEESYNIFITELNNVGNQRKILNEMIKNYQQRLQILENVLKQIEQIKSPVLLNDDSYL